MNPAGRWKEILRPYYLRWIYFPLAPGAEPPAFRLCWRHPFEKLGAGRSAGGPLEAFAGPSHAPDVILYPMTDWHTRIQRSQQLARAFAALGHRVLYLNPHLGRQFDTVPLFDREHRVSCLAGNIAELHVRLPREPVFHHRRLSAAEARIVAAAIERLTERMGPRPALQLVSFPVWMETAGWLRREHGFPVIYDCHDLLEGFPNVAPGLLEAEQDALAAADLVLFSSRFLAEHWLERRPEIEAKMLLVRNAADAPALLGEAGGADRIAPGRAAGYVGAIEEWFDAALLEAAIHENPECRFRIAGRVESRSAAALGRYPNVEFLGELPHSGLPAFLSGLRAGLIPFKQTALTRAANPIKLYEYFAFGLPVVSSALPEVEAYGELVYVASTPAGFAAQFRRAMDEDDPARRAARRAVAGEENWTGRARAILRAAAALPPGAGRGCAPGTG